MADPVPLTPAQIGGQVVPSVAFGYGLKGPFRGLLLAFNSGTDLTNAVLAGEIQLPRNRWALMASPTLTPNTIAHSDTPIEITVTGTSFSPSSVVFMVSGGSVALPTTYVSPTELRAVLTPSSAGAVQLVVVVAGQVITNYATFTIT